MITIRPKTRFSKSHLSVFLIIFAILGIILLIESLAAPNPNLPGDLNGDNKVDVTDMSILLSNYGTTNASADINGDGTVNVLDLSILLSHYGQSITTAANIPPSTAAHNIDGNLSESDWSISTPVTKCVLGTCNNTVTYGTLWDNSYLYVGVKVLDGNLYNDSANCWDDDSVEVYVDPTNAGGTTYTANDRQIVQRYNDSGLCSGVGSSTGVLHAWAPITGGYSVELAIPWSLLGTTASSGKTIGFDVGVNDDDNGGSRDSQMMWNGTAQNSTNPSGFGKLTLNGTPTGGAPTGGGGGGGGGGTTAGKLGMYIWGYGSINNNLNFGQRMTNMQTWLGGQTVTYGEDFSSWDTWDNLVPTWVIGPVTTYKQWPVVYAMPLLPRSLFGGGIGTDSQVSTELQNSANGNYDSYYVTAAQRLAQCGIQCPYLRLSHEFNLGYKADRCAPNPTAWINSFRHVVNIVRQYDSGIKIVWNPSQGWNQIVADNCYPGDSYVDVVGLDIYDEVYQNPTPTDPSVRWNIYLTETVGLNWLDSFSQAHNKPLAIPEWGTNIKYDTVNGVSNVEVGGMDFAGPGFVQNMHDWLAARVSHEAFNVYFNVQAPDGKHQLTNTNWSATDNTVDYPNSAAKFRSLQW